MEAIQSSYILTVGSGLSTEARCVAAQFVRQLRFLKDYVTIDIRQWHLRCWDNVQLVCGNRIHLPFLIRELSGSDTGSFVHHKRRNVLGISCLICFIEEETDQCSLELCPFAFVEWESCAGHFRAQLKIDEVILLSKFPVWFSSFVQSWNDTVLIHYFVVCIGFTCRNQFMRRIRHLEQMLS